MGMGSEALNEHMYEFDQAEVRHYEDLERSEFNEYKAFIDNYFKGYEGQPTKQEMSRAKREFQNQHLKQSKMGVITTVKSVQPNGTFINQHGVDLGNGQIGFFKFEYQMDDGQTINANHKANQSFNPGDQVEYEITNATYNGGKVNKPQENPQSNQGGGSNAPTPQPSNQYKQDPAKAKSIEMQVCLKEANQYHSIHGFVAGDVTNQQQVCDTADIFYTLFTK